MPKQDFKEYTRLRDIAVKRLKRLAEKEPSYSNIYIPKVADLKGESPETIAKAIKNLETYIAKGASLSRKREAERENLPKEVQKRRNGERLKSRLRVAKELGRGENYMKGVSTLGIDIPPSQVPAFIQYMDYRLAQGKSAFKYAFAKFAEDFEHLIKRKFKPDEIISDFEQFTRDYQKTQKKAQRMKGWTSQKFKNAWDRYLEAKGED